MYSAAAVLSAKAKHTILKAHKPLCSAESANLETSFVYCAIMSEIYIRVALKVANRKCCGNLFLVETSDFSTQSFPAYNGTLVTCKIINCIIFRFKILVCIWIITIRYREKQVFTRQNSKECPSDIVFNQQTTPTKMEYKPKSEKQNKKWMKGVSISPWLTTPWLERFDKDEFKGPFSASPSSGKHFFHVLKKVSSIIWIDINFKTYCHYRTVYVRRRIEDW